MLWFTLTDAEGYKLKRLLEQHRNNEPNLGRIYHTLSRALRKPAVRKSRVTHTVERGTDAYIKQRAKGLGGDTSE